MNRRTETWRGRGMEAQKDERKEERTEGRMEHWSHEQQDGGQARDEGVTEKIFARGMGLAAVRSWQ